MRCSYELILLVCLLVLQKPAAVLPVGAAVAADVLRVVETSHNTTNGTIFGFYCQEDGAAGSLPICSLQGE